MKNFRTWGVKPYRVAVVHGGPGAPGSVAPVAKELSRTMGVLEPLQTENSLKAQVLELRCVLEKHGSIPVVLIGHSWGAFLSFIVASRYPSLVKKLIMVGSGPFEEEYAASIVPERFNRLSEKDRIEAIELINIINDTATLDKDTPLERLGELFARADAYLLLPQKDGEITSLKVSEEINRRVWAEAKELRTGGAILKMGRQIKCPVVAIHGDYDPHPADGVRKPLARILKDFRFILLEKCGHEPWLEKFARDRFFAILKKEI